MAKELFAGQKKNKYRIVISKQAVSRKNLTPLLRGHNKILIISDNGVPAKIIKTITKNTRHTNENIIKRSIFWDDTIAQSIEKIVKIQEKQSKHVNTNKRENQITIHKKNSEINNCRRGL